MIEIILSYVQKLRKGTLDELVKKSFEVPDGIVKTKPN
jgi:hypothetical protein